MASEERKSVTIESLLRSGAIVGHKDGNYGSQYPRVEEFGAEGVPFLTAKSITDGRIDIDGAPRLSDERANGLRFGFVQPDDVLLSHNATIGRVAVVPKFKGRLLIGTSLTYFRVDPSRISPRYLAAYFAGSDFQNQLSAVMSHSTRNQVPITAQRSLRIVLPSLAEQVQIADSLGVLDDKIELNRKMNETLEAMARALFKSWFVDFEPVRAKAEGRDTGLPAHIASLFPDSFEDSELGPLPIGWKAMRVEDVSERIAMGPFGSSIKVETFVDAGVPVISGQHLRGFMLEDSIFNFITVEHAQRLAKAEVYRGDVIFTHAGSIGQAAFIPEESLYERYVISQRQFFMRCNRSLVTPSFITLYFGTDVGRHKLLANTSSSGVPSIARPVSYLRSILIPVPPSGILQQFECLTAPLLSKYRKNQDNNTSLTQLRDSLLPRLITGEIRVGQAERAVAEVEV